MFEQGEDGWIVASIPEVPGAHSQGRTRDEARAGVIDALRGILEVRFGGSRQRHRRSSSHACRRMTPRRLRASRSNFSCLRETPRPGASPRDAWCAEGRRRRETHKVAKRRRVARDRRLSPQGDRPTSAPSSRLTRIPLVITGSHGAQVAAPLETLRRRAADCDHIRRFDYSVVIRHSVDLDVADQVWTSSLAPLHSS